MASNRVPCRAALVRHRARPVRARRATQLGIATAVARSVQWTMDFKGNLRLGHRSMCHPLTLQDDATRYVLCVDGIGSAASLRRLRALDEHGPRARGAGDALPGRRLRGVAEGVAVVAGGALVPGPLGCASHRRGEDRRRHGLHHDCAAWRAGGARGDPRRDLAPELPAERTVLPRPAVGLAARDGGTGGG